MIGAQKDNTIGLQKDNTAAHVHRILLNVVYSIYPIKSHDIRIVFL